MTGAVPQVAPEPAAAFPAELEARAGLAAADVCDDQAWRRWLDSHDGADRQAELDADLARPLGALTRAEARAARISGALGGLARRLVSRPGASLRPSPAR